jgi:hypothetical protein
MQYSGRGSIGIPIIKAKGHRVYGYQSYQYSQGHRVYSSQGKSVYGSKRKRLVGIGLVYRRYISIG